MSLPKPPTRVTVDLINCYDAHQARTGDLADACVRKETGLGAVIDTRVLTLLLPPEVIHVLGLARTADDPRRLAPVVVTILGRKCTVEPFESPDHDRVVIGHIPLTATGLMIDSNGELAVDAYPGR